MTDDLQDSGDHQPKRRKKRTGQIRVLPPAVAPMTREDREQAVIAMATLIASWWHDHQHDQDL
jgi:hypothetical protein